MIEDELRAAMRAHDGEAPTADDFRIPDVRRPRALAPIASAAIVVLIVIGAIVFREHAQNPSAAHPTPCPDHFVKPVPALPRGVDTHDRLAPAAVPVSGAICAYPGKGDPGLRQGTRTISNLSTLAAWVSELPRAVGEQLCFDNFTAASTDAYYLRLDYPNGELWISAPSGCARSTNGTFTTAQNLRSDMAQAYSSGSWPAPTTVQPDQPSDGRLGSDQQLVPGNPTSLTVFRTSDHRVKTLTSGFGDLVRALNAAPHMPTRHSCGPSGAQQFLLTFHYASGPGLSVDIENGCYPEVDNGGLQIRSGRPFVPLVNALLDHP